MIEYREFKSMAGKQFYDCILEGKDVGTLVMDKEGRYFYMAARGAELSMEAVKDISFKLHALNWRSR